MAEFVSNITVGQLWAGVLLISVICTTISKIIEGIVRFVSKAQAPEKAQNERIEALERDVVELKKMLTNDDRRLKDFEEANQLVIIALLNLLRHGLDGNDINGMKKARDELESYLARKVG